MADKIVLYESLEEFINNQCSFEKLKSFKINYHSNNSNKENLPLLYDNSNYIQCLIKKKDQLDNNQKDIQLLIKDSSFELVIFKNDKDLETIKCLLLLIVNDYTINDKEEAEKFDEEKIVDINSDENILDILKIFLFDYIKENKTNKTLDEILLGESKDNIRFFNNEENKIFINEIKKINFEIKIEINNKNSMNDILDELNPSFKEELMGKLLDEMPEELVDLMKKYKNVNFTNEMYLNYLDYKNKPKEEKENKEENEGINSPKKKENNDENNINSSSAKKHLFKIK